MGKNLIVSYDLSQPNRDYEILIEQIKSLGSWARVHYSVWYVDSNLSAEQARDSLLPYLDTDDSLFIVDATNNEAAWHNIKPEVAKFLKEHWPVRLAA